MLPADAFAFIRAALPPPPARVLEIGAGNGELARGLREAGFEVSAIDPAADEGTGVEALGLIDAHGTFDAALAVVSLHHVEPLAESCAHLATLVKPGGRLVVDEFDVGRLDERAATWWLEQRQAAGAENQHDAPGLVAFMRHHVHALEAVRDALKPHFAMGEPTPCAYLHRWNLEPGLRDAEERLIASGGLPATGARFIATRPLQSQTT
jgi:SAM-dependent methyltransferase